MGKVEKDNDNDNAATVPSPWSRGRRSSSVREIIGGFVDLSKPSTSNEPGALAVNPMSPVGSAASESFHMDYSSHSSTHNMDDSHTSYDSTGHASTSGSAVVARRKTLLAASIQADLHRNSIASSIAEPESSSHVAVGAHAVTGRPPAPSSSLPPAPAPAPATQNKLQSLIPAGSNAALSRQAHHANSKKRLSLSSHGTTNAAAAAIPRNSTRSILSNHTSHTSLMSSRRRSSRDLAAISGHDRRLKLASSSRHSVASISSIASIADVGMVSDIVDVDEIVEASKTKDGTERPSSAKQVIGYNGDPAVGKADDGQGGFSSSSSRRLMASDDDGTNSRLFRRRDDDNDIPVLSEMVSARLVVDDDDDDEERAGRRMTQEERDALFEQAQREAEDALHEKMMSNMVTAEAVVDDEDSKKRARRYQFCAGAFILVAIFVLGGLLGSKHSKGDNDDEYIDLKNTPPPPINDVCTAAIVMEWGTDSHWQEGTTFGAGDSKLPSCTSPDEFVWGKSSVWYRIVGSGIPLRVSANDTTTTIIMDDDDLNHTTTATTTIPWNLELSVYSGQCGALTCIALDTHDDDDDLSATTTDEPDPSSVTWFAEMGIVYYVCVHGAFRDAGTMEDDPYGGTTYGNGGGGSVEAGIRGEATGNDGEATSTPIMITAGNFSLLVDEAVGNDFCPGAIDLEVASKPSSHASAVKGSTKEATADSEYVFCGNTQSEAAGVWYRVNGTGTPLEVKVRPDGGDDGFNTQVTVFQSPMGLDCSELLCIAGDKELFQRSSHVTWLSEEGVEYFILVHGVGNQRGSFELIIEERIANDLCESATALEVPDAMSGATRTLMGTVEGASLGSSLGVCGRAVHSGRSVWFTMVGTGETIQVSTCYLPWQAHSSPRSTMLSDTVLSVFGGEDCTNLVCIDGEDSSCGTHAAVTWDTKAGQVYHILVSGKFEESGSFQLSWQAV